ncbi:MAG: hypothetical protein HYU67_13775 [Flavobacteriia bacterium]|nr:hypothetical protein [Flavobacteriia bacterium]
MYSVLIKISFLTYFISAFSLWGVAQNLVPNPSFEEYINCPFSLDIETYLYNWKSSRETPDYFNSCASWWGASVPFNGFGYQMPNSGEGYIGLLTYRSDSAIYTEAIGVQLTEPLQIDVKYYVSFKTSLTLENSTGSMAANNKIGVQFTTNEYSSINQIPINNFAHVYTNSIISDTLNWTTISGSFISDSTYSFINIGNFFEKQFIDSIIFNDAFGAYYYIDDICVSIDSSTCLQYANLNKNENKQNFSLTLKDDHIIVKNNTKNNFAISISNLYGQKIFEKLNNNEYFNKFQLLETKNTFFFITIKSEGINYNYKLINQ